MDEKDWEKSGGNLCPSCHKETLRLIDGVCPACDRKAKERAGQEIEMKALLRSLREQRARNR